PHRADPVNHHADGAHAGANSLGVRLGLAGHAGATSLTIACCSSIAGRSYGNHHSGDGAWAKSMCTCLPWVTPVMPSTPSSRPRPLNFMPPNGAASLSFSGSLIQTVPACSSVAARIAFWRLEV